MSLAVGGDHDHGYGPLVATTVRVATWNLWGTWGPWEARAPAIHATLRAAAPDIVALQEVWESADGRRNQAREIAATLGGHHCIYAPNLTRGEYRSGNAILSRWPIVRHEVRVLPRAVDPVADDEGEERLCVFAEIDGPRGAVQVFCAHLSWRGDHSAIRQAQVAAIADLVRSTRPRPAFPAVLCGDLNAEPDAEEIRMLTGKAAVPVRGVWFRDVWASVGDGPGHTWSNANPWAAGGLDAERRLDYLLTGNPKLGGAGQPVRASLLGVEPVDGVVASDHYGVVADLRY